jgi:hypothetical protein
MGFFDAFRSVITGDKFAMKVVNQLTIRETKKERGVIKQLDEIDRILTKKLTENDLNMLDTLNTPKVKAEIERGELPELKKEKEILKDKLGYVLLGLDEELVRVARVRNELVKYHRIQEKKYVKIRDFLTDAQVANVIYENLTRPLTNKGYRAALRRAGIW